MRTSDPSQLEQVEFYAQDLGFLKDAGYNVRIVTRVRGLLTDILKHGIPDLYFCWWWTWAAFPVALSRILRRPSIITGTFNHHLYRSRPLRQRALISFAARASSANLFVSQMERDKVIQMIYSIDRPLVSPHCVDTEVYRPDGARDPDLLFQLVWMADGNSVRKCAAQSIRALSLLSGERPNLKLVIAGERGDDYPSLRALANELGIGDRVTFPGRITREEKVRLLQRCAVYLQPSLFEGFGLAAAEAMSCGAPVITSNVGAVREVCGEAVRYVDGSNPNDIANEIRFLLDRPGQRAELGQSARRRIAELFSPERRRRDIAATIHAIRC